MTNSQASTAISIKDFSFSYKGTEKPQLSSINLTIPKGAKVAVMGKTGAGKTTLAMALNGLIPHHHEGAFDGEIEVLDVSTARSELSSVVRHVGLVMQDAESQISGRTALEDAAVGPANFGYERMEVWARAHKALDVVGLSGLEERDTSQMSGGQQQRLVVAGMLALSPEIIVLDEPTSELDPEGASEIYEIVDRLSSEEGKTIILVDHDSERVCEWANLLLVLRDGEVYFWGTPRDFFSNADLVEDAGLRQPDISSLATKLLDHGLLPPGTQIPITLTEGIETLSHAKSLPSVKLIDHSRTSDDTVVAPGKTIIHTEKLNHVYQNGVHALCDVSLSIAPGDFVALLGRNGAGKTTFARHLNNLLTPTSGSVHINGKSIAGVKVSDLAEHIGYVFQNPDHQIFAASVFDEIAFGMRNKGWEESRIDRRVNEVLEAVELPDIRDKHPFTLGKGERQRIAVASVLALEPEVLVIDEPTTGQDWAGAISMMELVSKLNYAGHTILMITHDMLLASRYARRAVVFSNGSVAFDGRMDNLFNSSARVNELFLKMPQVTRVASHLGLGNPLTVDELLERWLEYAS